MIVEKKNLSKSILFTLSYLIPAAIVKRLGILSPDASTTPMQSNQCHTLEDLQVQDHNGDDLEDFDKIDGNKDLDIIPDLGHNLDTSGNMENSQEMVTVDMGNNSEKRDFIDEPVEPTIQPVETKSPVDRAPLWDYCLNLSSTSSPWCLLGDFNCVTNLSEISGGREHFTPDMQAFQDCLANCGLDRVRTVGDIFTWSNKRLLNPVFKSLDRMVANGAWFNLFTEGNVFIKPRSIMDHNALLFVEPMQLHRFGKPFQFFNFLIEVPGFFEVVDKAWSKPCTGNSYARFACKLKELKVLLRQFNKDHGNVSSNVSTARANLEEFQLNMLNTEDASLLSVENNLIRNLNLALAEEESLFLQKSRVKWMGLGDGNNSFFHQQCKAHWNRNKILVLQDESGTMVHGQQLCADVAVQYFQQLLGPQVVHSTIDLEAVDCTVISEAQATALSASVNDDLIYSTLKKMKKNKSPGPDGVNAEFFLATWCTTGKDFCDSIRSFFDTALHLGPDLLLWNGMDVKKIKTWHIWDSIRFRAGRVPWYQGVWHKLRVNSETTAKGTGLAESAGKEDPVELDSSPTL
ncbi:hypothetical protein AgCh_010817 [Apium graveolens]